MGHKRPRIPAAVRAASEPAIAAMLASQANRTAWDQPTRRAGVGTTDTVCMKRTIVIAAMGIASLLVGASAACAGGPCRGCGDTAAGQEYQCRDGGCGPRYFGAVFEELPWKDPCDCQGNRCDVPQGLDMLAPWQLPPCRGFTPPKHLGYGPTQGVCDNPGKCHPCTKGSILGFRPGPLWWF
jgi:hypothetical protein